MKLAIGKVFILMSRAYSSSAFRDTHTIHFSAPIGKCKGLPAKSNGRELRLFEKMDVIDLDRSGDPRVKVEEGFNRLRIRITEPVLMTGPGEMEQFARQHGTDVILQEDVKPINIGEPQYDLGKYWWSRPNHFEVLNERSLDVLLHEVGPLPSNARWAIDVVKEEFLVYSPIS